VGLELLGVDIRSGGDSVSWLADVGACFRAIFTLWQITHHPWNGMSFRAFNLWQLAFKIGNISAYIYRCWRFGFQDEFTDLFTLNSGDWDQKISKQLVLRSEVSFCAKMASLLVDSSILFLRLHQDRAGCLSCLLCLFSQLNFSCTSLQWIVNNGFKRRGFNVLFMMVSFIQNVEGYQSLVLFK